MPVSKNTINFMESITDKKNISNKNIKIISKKINKQIKGAKGDYPQTSPAISTMCSCFPYCLALAQQPACF